jgi:two-component system copper resistance phosphate regulon response regulator CusR
MTKILIVEDEPKTVQALQKGLEEHHYQVDIAYDGLVGKQLALQNPYQLLIIDIIIPGINGVELLREVRQQGIGTPVLMLTAMDSVEDKIRSFDSGADQFMPKPFDFSELLSRIRALTRRASDALITSQYISFADLRMNLDDKTVYRSGVRIELSAREFALLEFFIRNQGKVLSKTEISLKVWDIDFDTGTNVVEVYVSYLRKKVDRDFEKKLIHTHFGMGYVLREES